MSILVDDCSAAFVAPSRLRLPVTGARLLADDAQPRFLSFPMPTALVAWRQTDGFTMRGLDLAAPQDQDGRTAVAGAAYVTTTAIKQHSTRSGPPTSRPPA